MWGGVVERFCCILGEDIVGFGFKSFVCKFVWLLLGLGFWFFDSIGDFIWVGVEIEFFNICLWLGNFCIVGKCLLYIKLYFWNLIRW